MDYTNYFENGNAGEYRSYESDIKGETWVNIKMKMKSQGRDDDGKLKDHKWDIYANDELIFSDVMFRCIGFVRGDGFILERNSFNGTYGVCPLVSLKSGVTPKLK